MTDNRTPDISDMLAKYDRAEALRNALWPANKASVLAALAAAHISFVLVTFDGYGDSGQIESLEAKKGDTIVALPTMLIAWQEIDSQNETAISSEIALSEAIEKLVYDCLRQTHCGWENNEGAFGEVCLEVEGGRVKRDYNQRFESSEYTQHIL